MCILGLLLNSCDEYPFILIDNRDENPFRPAEQTITLDAKTGVLCARDLQGGGTWCGYNTLTGSIAVLTNVDDDPHSIEYGSSSSSPSFDGASVVGIPHRHKPRGAIINQLLHLSEQETCSSEFYERYLNDDERWLHGYRGFNLICGNVRSILGVHPFVARSVNQLDGQENSSVVPTTTMGMTKNGSGGDHHSGKQTSKGNMNHMMYYMSNRVFEEGKTWPKIPQRTTVKRLTGGGTTKNGNGGVYCVSNSYLNDESWIKVNYMKQQLHQLVDKMAQKEQDEQQKEEARIMPLIELRDRLGQILNSRKIDPEYDETMLPERCKDIENMTQIQLDDERISLHSFNNIFVNYWGKELSWVTRSQTIIIGEKNGAVHYFYRNCDQVTHDPHSLEAKWDHVIIQPTPQIDNEIKG